MAKESFINDFIKKTGSITGDDIEIITDHFEKKTFKKSSFLLKYGEICNDYLIVEKGFLRAYTYDPDGNEITTSIYGAGSVVFEVSSYFKRIPSKENIQAITEVTAWKGNYENFQTLFHSVPKFREFGRMALVNGFIGLKERMLSMINLTAEQRYELLVNTRPDIIHNVPLKYIASYLGITDTSLSRIRKKFLRDHLLPNGKKTERSHK